MADDEAVAREARALKTKTKTDHPIKENDMDYENPKDASPSDASTKNSIYGATRPITPTFPTLVGLTGREISPIELDVDHLQVETSGGWLGVIHSITRKWVTANRFNKRGTIWVWFSPSVNFGHHGMSAFLVVYGLPSKFRNQLGAELSRRFNRSVRVNSDYVTPNRADGWAAQCHVEEGRVWAVEDGASWREVVA